MEVKLSAVCNSHGTHRLGNINSSSLSRAKAGGCFPMQSRFAQYLILCLCFITVNTINMQFLLKKRSATFPRRQPSGGFGKICHVHPERAHICRCINFTTIPQRIQDKCITFILLLYISPRNPCNCDTPYCAYFGAFAGVTQVTRISAVLRSTRLRVPHPQKNIFRRIRPFLGILSFFVEPAHHS